MNDVKTGFEPHTDVFEYDGAYQCLTCGAKWGALLGNPQMPTECHERADDE